MSPRARPLTLMATLAALIIGGSAATAMPSKAKPTASSSTPSESDTSFLPGLGYLRALTSGSSLLGVSPRDIGAIPAAEGDGRHGYAGLPPDAFAGYATATVFHTDPELATDAEGEALGAEYDLGLSDAAHSTVPVPAVTDELGRDAIPALDAGHSFGQGQGINLPDVLEDVDFGADLDPAVAHAPPSRTAPLQKSAQVELGIVKSDAFEAEALARAIPTGCVLGDDLARGLGAANRTDVDLDGDFDDEEAPLLSISVDDPPPPRAVSQSLSRVALSSRPVSPGRFGAIAESRLTVAPITFGIPGEKRKDSVLFTLELAGEFILRAASDGQRGQLFFGPDNGDDRPVARLFLNGDEIGGAGFGEIVPITVGDETIGEIRIGDDPHAIGDSSTSDPSITATRVAAAADVAVVQFYAVGAQQRVGHMEVDLSLPAGGVSCPGIALDKRSDPATVTPGRPLTFTIDVLNPNDCVLSELEVKDSSTSEPGVTWSVATTSPRSTISRDGTLRFKIDPLRPGERRTIRINAEVAADSKPGTVSNTATATGVCARIPLEGAAKATASIGTTPPPLVVAPPPAPSVPASHAAPVAAPAPVRQSAQVRPGDVPRSKDSAPRSQGNERTASDVGGGVLARTGASLPFALALSLVGAGRALRRARTR